MTEIFTVETRGVGKPDYTRIIEGSKQRAGLHLEYNQQLVTFAVVFTDQIAHPSPLGWVQPPLAAGDTAHLYDQSTGIVMPYNWPTGYTLTLLQYEWANNEDIEIWLYIDTILAGCPATSPSGDNQGWNMVVMFDQAFWDPTASSPHIFDIQVVNVGGLALEGAIDFVMIYEKVGSPDWPVTKDCRCPFCGNMQTVAVGTTRIICEKCGRLFVVYDFSKVRRT